MSNDAPQLNGFTFNHHPIQRIWWENQLVKHTISDGSTVIYNKGFILKGTLEWGNDGWIDQDELSNVTVMYNTLTATAKFYPRPNTYPNRNFNIQIVNEFNFVPHEGHLQIGRQLYQGTIEIESSIGEMTATAGVIF